MFQNHLTYYTTFWLLMALLSLSNCHKPDASAFQENKIVVQGVLIAGANSQSIKIINFDTKNPINDAHVDICHGNDCCNLSTDGNGIYFSGNDLQIYPDSTYRLEISYQEKSISSTTKIPASMTWVSVNNTIITIDTANTGQQVFVASWAIDEDVSFLLTLQNTEENPQSINYSSDPLEFNDFFEAPQANPNITLQDLFFTHYGAYIFTVYAIDKRYEKVFLYQPQLQQIRPESGPDNIQGAFGYFTGVSQLKVNITVNE